MRCTNLFWCLVDFNKIYALAKHWPPLSQKETFMEIPMTVSNKNKLLIFTSLYFRPTRYFCQQLIDDS